MTHSEESSGWEVSARDLDPSSWQLCSGEAVKVVRKPWGAERWLVQEGRPFGFKLIEIDAGCRTSLQYHERKHEANLILAGEGYLYVGQSADSSVARYPLTAGDVVDIPAGVVHRIAATSPMRIVEASTPELDDVIRIADDTRRGNGRIEDEHRHQGG